MFKCKSLHTALGVFGAQAKSSTMHKVLKQNDIVTNITLLIVKEKIIEKAMFPIPLVKI